MTNIASILLLLQLFLQIMVQCAQCQAMTAAKLATPQTARLVQTCHPRNLRPTLTMNYRYSLSAQDNSPSQPRPVEQMRLVGRIPCERHS
jgi:hypothetical protein